MFKEKINKLEFCPDDLYWKVILSVSAGVPRDLKIEDSLYLYWSTHNELFLTEEAKDYLLKNRSFFSLPVIDKFN